MAKKKEFIPYTPAFEECYRKYPKRVGKQDAMQAWVNLGAEKNEKLQQAISEDLSKRAGTEGYLHNSKFTKQFSVYLNNHHWDDDIIKHKDNAIAMTGDSPQVEVDPTVTDEQILNHMNITKMKIDEAACALKVTMRRVEFVVTNNYEEIIHHRLKMGLDFTSIYYQLKRDITNYLSDLRRFENERSNVGQPGSEHEQVSEQERSGGSQDGPESDGPWL